MERGSRRARSCLREHQLNTDLMASPTSRLRRAATQLFFRCTPLLFWLLPVPCFGALHWDNLQVRESAWAGDKDTVAVFRFQNAGNVPITIISLKSSCGCTTAEVSKMIYAAGESGEVKATFEIGNRTGQQTKIITVISDDAPSKPTILVYEINVQEFAIANPKFVYWRVGEAAAAKKVEIVAAASQSITAITATPNNPDITARIETIEAGKKYFLWLKPASTSVSLSADVPCAVRIGGRSQSPVAVYASIIN